MPNLPKHSTDAQINSDKQPEQPLDATVSAGTIPTVAWVPETPAVAPRRLGHHELLEKVGGGGMGMVFKARHLILDRIFALKIINAGALADEKNIQRFLREARAAAELDHPNIVRIFEIGCEQEQHYFTMTHVPGGDLAQRRQEFAEPRTAAALVAKLARAVHYAHGKGIIHRDLKPGNVLVDEHGEPRISDFGLAKLLDGTDELTCPGESVGTPAYMSPEQAAGEVDRLSPASDVWSLGVILYELLTSRRPFDGPAVEEVREAVRRKEPRRPRSLKRDLDMSLEAIVLKCLEKAPEARYATAEALADDLARWLSGESTIAKPQRWPRRVWRWTVLKRKQLAIGGVLSIALVVAGWIIAANLRTHQPKRETLVLIDERGRLFREDRLLGEGTLENLGEGVVRLDAAELCLVQVGQPRWERYRLKAKVQAIGACKGAGIFFGHEDHTAAEGTEHWFFAFEYSEENTIRTAGNDFPQAAASVALRRHTLPGQGSIPGFDRLQLLGESRFFPGHENRWRLLVVTVTPESVSGYWDDEEFPFMTAPCASTIDIGRKRLASLRPALDAPPSLDLEGGLGIVCEKGAALFKDMSVEQLP
jgi:serine/threonine-protein kinase